MKRCSKNTDKKTWNFTNFRADLPTVLLLFIGVIFYICSWNQLFWTISENFRQNTVEGLLQFLFWKRNIFQQCLWHYVTEVNLVKLCKFKFNLPSYKFFYRNRLIIFHPISPRIRFSILPYPTISDHDTPCVVIKLPANKFEIS